MGGGRGILPGPISAHIHGPPEAQSILPFSILGARADSCIPRCPGPQALQPLGLSPLGNPGQEKGPRGPSLPFSALRATAAQDHPRSWPTLAWTRSARASPQGTNRLGARPPLTAAHLGPGAGWPKAGGLCLIVFRHQLHRLESHKDREASAAPWSSSKLRFLPQERSISGWGWPSLSPLSLCTRHLASHQLSTGPQQTHQRQAGVLSPIPPIPKALPGATQRSDELANPTHSAFIQSKVQNN